MGGGTTLDAQALRRRLIGTRHGSDDGPVLLVLSALHGNEPSGVNASLRVLNSLDRRHTPCRGRLVMLLGNVSAFDARARFIDEDLNRIWLPERVAAHERGDTHPDTVENNEMRELLAAIRACAGSDGGRYLLDLHTTSAPSPPFIALAGDNRARRVADRVGAIEVRGICEFLPGMMVNFASSFGWTALAFEAGSHRDSSSEDTHEALIWHALETAGIIDPAAVPAFVRARERELRRPEHIEPAVQVIHHHPIDPDDRFRMRLGYRNFQPVKRGEVLADDRNGPIESPHDGRVFMPLYQPDGRDGFFIVRDLYANAREDAA